MHIFIPCFVSLAAVHRVLLWPPTLVWTEFYWVTNLYIGMIYYDVFVLGEGLAAVSQEPNLQQQEGTQISFVPQKAFSPTSVGPEVNRRFCLVYQFWLHVVMVQVVQQAADFQHRSCKYELSRIWILLNENNDDMKHELGLFFGAWCSGGEVGAAVVQQRGNPFQGFYMAHKLSQLLQVEQGNHILTRASETTLQREPQCE